jgi:8-oxo-dGTP pyrophosphatase MutT (NUDIX family)
MAERLTHAGGIVYRLEQGSPVFLLVTARRTPSHWVFPKGHIEPGETPEETAVREVDEEAGVRATIITPIDDVLLRVSGENQRIRYFLMRAGRVGSGDEGRRTVWLESTAALERLTFEQARVSLRKALAALAAGGATFA